MTALPELSTFLAQARIDESVRTLRPDYRAVLVAVDGLKPAPTDSASDAWLRDAEAAAAAATNATTVEDLPHIAAWRDAYRTFGAKPQRTRNSAEALLRRISAGLPRVNKLTDLYNAVSVQHQVSIGGEDLRYYQGSPRLVRATGTEAFDAIRDGIAAMDPPDPGEVVWRDDDGVTCRRWNWRQGARTRLRDDTPAALFIIDALGRVAN